MTTASGAGPDAGGGSWGNNQQQIGLYIPYLFTPLLTFHSPRWFRQRHTFIGMLDADEFIVLRDVPKGHKPDLRSFLKPFEQHGGIVVSNMGGSW